MKGEDRNKTLEGNGELDIAGDESGVKNCDEECEVDGREGESKRSRSKYKESRNPSN